MSISVCVLNKQSNNSIEFIDMKVNSPANCSCLCFVFKMDYCIEYLLLVQLETLSSKYLEIFSKIHYSNVTTKEIARISESGNCVLFA